LSTTHFRPLARTQRPAVGHSPVTPKLRRRGSTADEGEAVDCARRRSFGVTGE
jgi:hypothetical protein